MSTSDENKNTMLSILAAVDELRLKEAALQSDKTRLEDQIKVANDELTVCHNNIEQCHEDALALKRQMNDLKDTIFARPETEETIVVDTAHDPSADAPSSESERQRAWKTRQKQLRSVE
jgi:hypothetical protein